MSETQNLILILGLESEADAGDFAAIVMAANADVVEQTDNSGWSLERIGERVGQLLDDPAKGLQARRLVADTLATAIVAQQPGFGELQAAQLALGNGSLTLHGPDKQATIQALAASWPADIREAVLSLGRRTVSPAVYEGHGPVTEEQLAADWRAYRVDQRLTNAAAAARSAVNAEQTTAEQAAAWAQAWETAAP